MLVSRSAPEMWSGIAAVKKEKGGVSYFPPAAQWIEAGVHNHSHIEQREHQVHGPILSGRGGHWLSRFGFEGVKLSLATGCNMRAMSQGQSKWKKSTHDQERKGSRNNLFPTTPKNKEGMPLPWVGRSCFRACFATPEAISSRSPVCRMRAGQLHDRQRGRLRDRLQRH